MNVAKDIVDKYSTEEIIASLDSLIGGVTQNYRKALKEHTDDYLWSSHGDILLAKDILYEMKSRNEAHEALKQN